MKLRKLIPVAALLALVGVTAGFQTSTTGSSAPGALTAPPTANSTAGGGGAGGVFAAVQSESTMESSWTTNGIEHTVKTAPRGGESARNQARRHKIRVDALTSIFPPDPPVTDMDVNQPPESLLACWSDGMKFHCVLSFPKEEEGDGAFVFRHIDAVQALAEEFPPALE